MRVYKIINEEKFLKADIFLKELKQLKKENIKTIKTNITPFEWDSYLGYSTSFHLLPTYSGFKPKKPIEKALDGWREDKDHADILVPNKRTKAGKEIVKKLDELPNFTFEKIAKVLDIKLISSGRFTIPSLRISKNKKHIFLIADDRAKLKAKDFKEVTITYVNKKLGIK
ncbi:hypothetical protein [Polaribacter atrinae]|uniref:hypothetical protein n=1 Tax=Polaribacter atrinae TaxID=1333662 RepID=UPI0030FA9BAA